MRTILVYVSVACCSPALADAPKPVTVFFYGKYRPAHTAFERSVVDQFGLDIDQSKQNLLGRPDHYQYEVADGFKRREGIASFVRPGSAELVNTRFLPVPTLKAFEQLVSNRAQRVKADEVVKISETLRHLKRKSQRDQYVRYDRRGVAAIWWDEQFARKSAAMDALVEVFRDAKGTHDYFSVRPSVVPQEYRLPIVRKVLSEQSVSLQQRDTEPDDLYAIRRKIGDARKTVVEVGLSELTEVTWWYGLPTDIKPMQAGVRIGYVPNGRIDRFVERISTPKRRLTVIDPDKSVAASMSVAVKLGEAELDVLSAVTKQLPSPWGIIGQSCLRENFELLSILTDAGVGEPALLVATPDVALAPMALKPIELPALGKIVPENYGEKIGPTSVAVLQFARERVEDVRFRVSDLLGRQRSRRGEWVEAKVDLSAWMDRLDDDSGSNAVLTCFEKLFDKWAHQRLINRYPPGQSPFDHTLHESDFRSLVSDIGTSGSWHGKLRVGPGRNSVTARVEIGSDLFRWLSARHILAEIRARKQ